MSKIENGYMPKEYEVAAGTRDAWQWPFAKNSIWNMPIGSDADYQWCAMRPAAAYYVDVERIYKTTTDDDYLEICHSESGRWPSEDKLIHTGKYMYWPKGLVVKPGTANECSAVLQPDGRTIIQLQPTCRAEADSRYIVGWERDGVDLYGDGALGAHWGSGLSCIGGTIRLSDITNVDEPIRHALKLNVSANRFAYYKEGVCPGYMWPADRADSYATNGIHDERRYTGNVPNTMMGTLLSVNPKIDIKGLGFSSPFAIKLLCAIRDYGVYIVDDSAWNAYGWSVEEGVEEEVKRIYGHKIFGFGMEAENEAERVYYRDMCIIAEQLRAVANNAPDSIGGGGTPRVPLAPDFAE